MDWHELHKKKVDELREMAKEYPDVGAVSGMHKDELVKLVADHMGIHKPHLVVEGIDKVSIKAEIRAWKVKRDAALEAKDKKALKHARRQIHKRKRRMRRYAHLD